MPARRIIPCLDVMDGRTVKGIRFEDLSDVGDPVALALRYAQDGADELVLLDISATIEERATFAAVVEDVAAAIAIPFTVGGGIRSEHDMERMLRCGADKVAVNTAAVADPSLIDRCAAAFGSQCVVVAVDVRREGSAWQVMTHSGKRAAGLDALEWVRIAEGRGAGEILCTSIDRDGTKEGFDTDVIAAVAQTVRLPLIASGGAGRVEHFVDPLVSGADAVLAAGMFHRGECTVGMLKNFLRTCSIEVR